MAAFVGRAGELGALLGLAELGRYGGPAAALVLGEPGSGKTRLLAEVAARVPVAAQLTVSGFETERDVPLASAAAALRELGVAPEHGSRLFELLHERSSTGLEPTRIFEAAYLALRAREPVLLLVDDLQWVDALSRAFVSYLLRAAHDSGSWVTLLAASRHDAEADVFEQSLRRSLAEDRVLTLVLPALDRVAGVALARALSPGLDSDAAEALWKEAHGSPFWLETLARGETGAVGRAVRARVQALTPDATDVLALLVAAARPLTAADLRRVAPRANVEDALADLERSALVFREGASARVAHDLIREAAGSAFPVTARSDAHRRLAEWLEGVGDDVAVLREALEHRRRAGLPTLELATRLVGAPRRTLLRTEGLELLDSIADETTGEALDLQEGVARLASELAVHETALKRWLLLARRRSSETERARTRLEAARSARALGRREQALELLAEARTAATPDPLLELELDLEEVELGLWLAETSDDARANAASVAERARSFATASDGATRHAYLEALRVAYEAAQQVDDLGQMLALAEERAAAAVDVDDEAYLTAVLAGAIVVRRLGRIDEAEHRAREAWDVARRRVFPRVALDAAYRLGPLLVERGRLSEARAVADEAVALADRAGDEARGRHRVHRIAAEVELAAGVWLDGLQLLEREVELTGAHGQITLRLDAALWVARVEGPDARENVRDRLASARACAQAAQCPRCSAELLLAAGEALARVGVSEGARRELAGWDAVADRTDPITSALRQRASALADADGDALAGAAEVFANVGLVLETLWTRIDEARARAPHDRDRAVEILRGVAETADVLGAVTHQEVAQRSLRKLGVRTWRRGRAAGGETPFESLTERETKIADLVASGASNAEIAQALFVSRKTVERHVSNVLRKLGARNRTELAGRLAQFRGNA
jgi:DNA-binding CsgD family transcriptional regulator